MRYPLKMTANLARYVASQRLRGSEKFPMVLMLEPLHACNLTCTGCGRIREYKSTISEMMTVAPIMSKPPASASGPRYSLRIKTPSRAPVAGSILE